MSRARAGGMGDALRVGLAEWRTVVLLLCANWLVAGLMVAPAVPRVLMQYGHTPLAVGKQVVSREMLWSLNTLFESGGSPSVGAPLLFLLVLQTFLAGGVVWRACAGGPFRLGAFFGQSGRLVGRNARLYLWLLLLLPVAALVPVLVGVVMHVLGLPTLFTQPAEAWIFGRPFGFWSLLHLAVVALALGLWRLSVEVGRVVLFRDDVRATRRAAWRAVRLVVRSPLAVVVYAVLGGLATLAMLLAMRARAMLPEGNGLLALLALGVAQGVLWIRLAFQVAGSRFAAGLVERLEPAAADAPPTETAVLPDGEHPVG